jgi:hypothetical protein
VDKSKDMPVTYHLSFGVKNECLQVQVTGVNTPQNVLSYLIEIQELCQRHSCSKVLIEENLEGPSINMFEIFEIIGQASQNIPGSIQKIAYVDINTKHNKKSMHFAETVAVNRGVNIKLFDTTREALSWLSE